MKIEGQEIQESLLKATASKRNGEINQEAVALTEDCHVRKGLKACGDFLTTTQETAGTIGPNGEIRSGIRQDEILQKS